jgi:hypothetical protein
MLTQEEQQAFIKTLSSGKFFPRLLQGTDGDQRNEERPGVPTRNRGTTAWQRTSTTGKRKTTELASDSPEPATRRPETAAGSSPQQLRTENATG